MSACKACGNRVRRTQRARVVEAGHGSEVGLVCSDCASGGLLIVAKALPPISMVKRVRAPEIDRIVQALTAYAKGARISAKSCAERLSDSATDSADVEY